MTISLNTPRNTYTATAGQTDFTIGFEFFAVADIKAFKMELCLLTMQVQQQIRSTI